MSNQSRVVSLEQVSYSYGTGALRKRILDSVNVELWPSEIVLLRGPSGSGKTTLLMLIGALRTVQEGKVEVLGTNLLRATPSLQIETRRKLGFIFQAHNLHRSLTAMANVRMGLELQMKTSSSVMDTLARESLEQVGLGDRALHYPSELSGGEKQRVAIARALVHRPQLLLADEPTAALDSKAGREVVNLMQRLAREQNTAILIVTHDDRILDVADRVISMEDGCIVGQPSSESLLSRNA